MEKFPSYREGYEATEKEKKKATDEVIRLNEGQQRAGHTPSTFEYLLGSTSKVLRRWRKAEDKLKQLKKSAHKDAAKLNEKYDKLKGDLNESQKQLEAAADQTPEEQHKAAQKYQRVLRLLDIFLEDELNMGASENSGDERS